MATLQKVDAGTLQSNLTGGQYHGNFGPKRSSSLPRSAPGGTIVRPTANDDIEPGLAGLFFIAYTTYAMDFFHEYGGDPLKPSLFELVSQEQLRDLLQPALKYVLLVRLTIAIVQSTELLN